MRSFNDVNDHTIAMINAIISGNYIVAGNILSSNDISLTIKLDEKNTVEHILLSEDSDLINLFIKQYQFWDLSESEILPSLIDAIYDYFSENPHHKVSLSVSSDSYRICEVRKLKPLRNITVDIPIPRSVTASLDREYQRSEFEPSSPSKWEKKSLMDYIETSPTICSLKKEAFSLMGAEEYSEGEITLTSGAQANSADMAAEEISTSQMNVGSADFDPGEDDELIFDMEEEEERASVNDYGIA